MGEWIELEAADGHRLDCYTSMPDGEARGGILLIQEIFGVNSHMRSVADRFAGQGYAVALPALFDRLQRKVELNYTTEDVAVGRKMRVELGWDAPALDLKAALDLLTRYGRVGAVGYCWGGSLAWLCASRLDLACAVSYYGGQIVQILNERPRCPVMLHFGELDEYIPMADIERIKSACPQAEVYVYNAGHGFNCDQRADYDETCAGLALERTLDFFTKHLREGL